VGTRLRRVLLRWQVPQPYRPDLVHGDRGGWTYASPYAGPYAHQRRTPHPAGRRITAGHAPRGASRPHNPRPTGPPRGSGAAAAGGALRAIDPSARPRLLADLRSAPPSAAISSPPWFPRKVVLQHQPSQCRRRPIPRGSAVVPRDLWVPGLWESAVGSWTATQRWHPRFRPKALMRETCGECVSRPSERLRPSMRRW